MTAILINILFSAILIGVLFWAANTILAKIPIAEPFGTIVYVLMVLLVLYVTYSHIIIPLSGLLGIHLPRLT